MIKKSAYKSELEKILASEEFSHASSHRRLLAFLFNAFEQQRRLNEHIIAFEIFGRDKTFNPSEDTIVRVYVHELRKKLDVYYKTQGANNKLQLTIPKGGYNLKFESQARPALSHHMRIVVPVLLFLFAVSLIANFYLYHKQHTILQSYETLPKTHPVWQEFLSDDKPVLIVLGDLFFFREWSDELQRYRIVRDFQINSQEELELLCENEHLSRLVDENKLPYTYLVEYCAWGLLELLPIFYSHHIPVDLRLSTDLSPQDLCDYNVIWIGYIKALGPLKSYFRYSKFDLNQEFTSLYMAEDTHEGIRHFKKQGNIAEPDHTDIGFFAKFPGPNNNTILLLCGFGMTGTMESIINFCNPVFLDTLQNTLTEKIGHVPPYFEGLAEVYGMNRKGLFSQIKVVSENDPDLHYWSKSGAP